MERRKKQEICVAFFAFILLFMGIAFYPQSVRAEDFIYEDFTYVVEDREVIITGYTGNGTDVVVPSAIKGKPVVEIRNLVPTYNRTVKNITIPDSVKIFHSGGSYLYNLESVTYGNGLEYAAGFANCEKLKNINFGNNIREFGGFIGCKALEAVNIPALVDTIEPYVFKDCSSLKNINVNAQNASFSSSNGILFNKNQTELWYYPEGKTEKEIGLQEGVTTLKFASVQRNIYLEKVVFPSTLTTVEYSAMQNCPNLKTVVINENLSTIQGVTENSEIVDYWGGAPFSACPIEKYEVHLKNGSLTAKDGVLFSKDQSRLIRYPEGNKQRIYMVPETVNEIADGAFKSKFLGEVKLNSALKKIGNSSFSQCTSLSFIKIPDSIEYIGDFAFSNSALTGFELPDKPLNYGANIFSGCQSLEYAALPGGMETAPSKMFHDCRNLKYIIFGEGITRINRDICADCTWSRLKIFISDSFKEFIGDEYFNAGTVYCNPGTAVETYLQEQNMNLSTEHIGIETMGTEGIPDIIYTGFPQSAPLKITPDKTSMGVVLAVSNSPAVIQMMDGYEMMGLQPGKATITFTIKDPFSAINGYQIEKEVEVRTPPADYVSIPDHNLAYFLMKQGADSNGDGFISKPEMASLTTFNIEVDENIKHPVNDLKGLEYATNLVELNIPYGNYGSTAEAVVSRLTKLKRLYLSDVEPNQCAFITNLRDLEEVCFNTNLIYNAEYFKGLAKMQKLLICIDDLNVLDTMSELKEVHPTIGGMSECTLSERLKHLRIPDKITLYEGIESVTNIYPSGLLDGNQMNGVLKNTDEAIGSVSIDQGGEWGSILLKAQINQTGTYNLDITTEDGGLKKIQVEVRTKPEDLVDIPDIRLESKLFSMGIDKNSDGYFSKAEMADLKTLNIENLRVASLEGLQYAVHLESLNISGNSEIKDISVLANAVNLKYLNVLWNSEIKDISMLANLEKLEKVDGLSSLNLRSQDIINILRIKVPEVLEGEVTEIKIYPKVGLEDYYVFGTYYSYYTEADIYKKNGAVYLKGVRKGELTGFVRYNGYEKTFPIKINAVEPTKFAVTPDTITVKEATVTAPTFSFEPENVTNKRFATVSSNNREVAYYERGEIHACKEGTAEITFVTENGLTDTLTVKVIASGVNLSEEKKTATGIEAGTNAVSLKEQLKSKGFVEDTSIVTLESHEGKPLSDTEKIGTGAIVKITKSEDVKIYTVIIKGDTTGDGNINIMDILTIQNHILNRSTLEDCYFEAGNLTGSEKRNILDILAIQNDILGRSSILQ